MSKHLHRIVARASARLRQALEEAAGLAQRLSHGEILLEHLFLSLLQPPGSDVLTALSSGVAGAVPLEADLHRGLATLRETPTRIPTVSRPLRRALDAAWVIASLDHDSPVLRSGHLLAALVLDDPLRQEAGVAFARLGDLPRTPFREGLSTTLAPSPESGDVDPGVADGAGDPAVLDRYTVDLTALARSGSLDPVLGRDPEIRQMIDILLRRRQNNPLLVGDPGVGKTAVVEGLAHRLIQGDLPPALAQVSLRTLDLGLLMAGAQLQGAFEARLKSLLAAVKASPTPVILFIDEAHTLVGAGAAPGQADAANLLKPALARGELRTIAATTWQEYRRHLERDPALARRFQVIRVEEPDEASALDMVQGMAPLLEHHHGVKILPETLRAAVRFTTRFLPGRLQPDKAISTLDTACARIGRSRGATEHPPVVDVTPLAEVLSDWTGLPLGRLAQDELQTLEDLEVELGHRVLGQVEALASLARPLRAARAGLTAPGKPRGAFLFTGPSGVGKTETAHALADLLLGGEHHLVTLHLSAFQEAHTVSLLKGAPPGYVGYGEGGLLTEAVRRRPHAIILFEDVDRAHPDVLQLLMGILDQGRLEDSEGRMVDFRHAILLFTTRIPVSASPADAHAPGPFTPAFLDHLHLVTFRPLPQEVLQAILQQKLEGLAGRLSESHDLQLAWDRALPGFLAQQCGETASGVRQAESLLVRTLGDPLSRPILASLAARKPMPALSVKLRKGRIQVLTA